MVYIYMEYDKMITRIMKSAYCVTHNDCECRFLPDCDIEKITDNNYMVDGNILFSYPGAYNLESWIIPKTIKITEIKKRKIDINCTI
jgi:hypothetical protein